MHEMTDLEDVPHAEEAIVLIDVVERFYGEVTFAMKDDPDEAITDKAIVLQVKVVDPNTVPPSYKDVDIIVPQSIGGKLLAALLTDEQFETLLEV